MGFRYCLFLPLIAAGVVISIFSNTDLFAFRGCTEAYNRLLFDFSFAPSRIAFFFLAGLFVSLVHRLHASALFSIHSWQVRTALMIPHQKNFIGAFTPSATGPLPSFVSWLRVD